MSMRRLGLGRGRTGTLGSRTAGMAEALKMGAATAEITPLIATEHQTGRGPRGILEAGADGIERGEIMAIGAAGSGDPRETELQPDLQVPPGLRRLHAFDYLGTYIRDYDEPRGFLSCPDDDKTNGRILIWLESG